MVRGALVELHFELHHYSIRKSGQDSFNASIEQITVLRPGEARPATAYKRKNPRDGPIRIIPSIALQKNVSNKAGIRATRDEDNKGPPMSEKRRGKQKERPEESEDEAEDDVM